MVQLLTMTVLAIVSIVHWVKHGNSQIHENWVQHVSGLSGSKIIRQIFDGMCLGLLGLTGFECELVEIEFEDLKHDEEGIE
jgi:hypothetical protein